MELKMILKSDAIFGNGTSIPGEEDISVQCDRYGFPYYKGGTFKGVFREELKNYLYLCGRDRDQVDKEADRLLGVPGNDDAGCALTFSDFSLSDGVKKAVLSEIGIDKPMLVREILTNIRSFTAMEKDGRVRDGSLRMARCVNKGLVFYGNVECERREDEEMVKNVLGFVKWIGTLRNRGFGKVQIEEV